MSSHTISRFSRIIVGISLLTIAYFTLFPFDIIFQGGMSLGEILRNFDFNISQGYAIFDFPRNMILFMPLGFGMAGMLRGKNGRSLVSYLFILFIGVGTSLTAEVLQTYTLQRFPTFGDVVSNGTGTAVGIVIFHFFGSDILKFFVRLIDRLKSFFTFRRVLAAYLLYLALWLSVSYLAQTRVWFTNWNEEYPLIIGNEATQERPWRGVIRHFQLRDRALTAEEVAQLFQEDFLDGREDSATVAYYDFVGEGQGNFPGLEWLGGGPVETAANGVHLSEKQWLQSERPVSEISEGLAGSSQFTLAISAASASADQEGPARMVSISKDPFLRNLTIGQEETDLVLRVRTPLTGLNGREPELVIPDVFNDQTFHQIVITYDRGEVHFFIDNPADEFAIELAPSVGIITKLFPDEVDRLRITRGTMTFFRLQFGVILLWPLTLLVLAWWKSPRQR